MHMARLLAVDGTTAALIAQHQPDLVVCGHSHKAAHWQAGSVHFINPGSAGEAAFTEWLQATPTFLTAVCGL